MRTWQGFVQESGAWQAIGPANEKLEALGAAHPGDEIVGRALRVLAVAKARLQATDPELVTDAGLSSLHSKIETMVTAIEGTLNDPTGPRTPTPDEASVQIDSLVEGLAALPSAAGEEAVATAEVFRRELSGVEERVRAIVAEGRDAIESVATQQAQVLAEQKDGAGAIGQELSEVESALSALQDQVEAFISERTAAADAAAAEAKAAHDAARERAKEAADDLVREATEAFSAEQAREREAHEQLANSFTEQADAVIEDITTIKGQVEALAGAVGRTGLSAGFQQWEEREGKDASRLRFAAITFGLLAAASVAVLLGLRVAFAESSLVEASDLVFGVAALSLPGAFGAVAVYAGRESARHRRNQIIARRTEIELNSFLPYLAQLEKIERDALTVLFTEVFFGQAGIHTTSSGDEDAAGPRSPLHEGLTRIASRLRTPEATSES